MILALKKQVLLALIFTVLSSISLNAQTYQEDSRTIDSCELFATKKLMNDLNTVNFERKIYKGVISIPYRLLVPKKVLPKKKYPLVITFHNSSRIGNDNESQLEPLARIWIRNDIYKDFNCFVIAPQFNRRSTEYVRGADGITTSLPSDDVREILKLLEEAEKKYPIDRHRIYLVGYSMGASTAQDLFSMEPDKFAALVSIAGVPSFTNIRQLKSKKIWLIHGKKDADNPYIGSERLYRMLAGNKRLLFTSYGNLDHNNIMIPYLLNEDIPKWLFETDK